MLYMYMYIVVFDTVKCTLERVRRMANWMALLPVKFQTGSAWAYTQEYMELSGVLLYWSNINSNVQHNLICNIGKIIPYG